ncbi:MAG: protein-glutamate O-methyltransferase [Rhodospirillales bacterium]
MADHAEARLTTADFNAIVTMVRETAGISLGANKRELVFGRLNRRLRALGLHSFSDYRALLDGPDGPAERGEMINAITTNLTSFFREPHHFKFLAEEVLPGLLANASRRLRIWSAACSSGEEAYTIAMVMNKALAAKGEWDARILATDIDTNMIDTAEEGRYDAERAGGIPPAFARLVTRLPDGHVEMPETLKQRIAFKPLNLLESWPMRGKFDVIFCRNVVIYFDKTVQRTLFDRFADIMTPTGYLFIGHSETLFRVSDRFESLGRTIYRKLR